MIKVGIVGATGYTGIELLRILVRHTEVEIVIVTSRSEKGRLVADLFPNLRGYLGLEFSVPSIDSLAQCDLVFFATPNGTAMKMVPQLLDRGVKIIDLAADFRLKSAAQWLHWYKMEHACPELLEKAVYGLPEINRHLIREARLVANPGCYPTAVQLGFLPLVKNDLVDEKTLIADVKSGISGAGRKAAIDFLLTEVSENMQAYAINGHRHLPEIVQGLNNVSAKPVNLTFMPHLTPMIRGIHATLYSTLKSSTVDLQALFENFYRDEPFVDVLEAGKSPQTRSVKGTNNCQIAICRPQDGDTVVVMAVEDNLVKGAAGQAVQNMNIMFGLDEIAGLEIVAVLP